MRRRSPTFNSLTAVLIASARSPISIAPGAACRIALRMAAGSSLRGLSSVTITRPAPGAAGPMTGRVAGSRCAPAPRACAGRDGKPRGDKRVRNLKRTDERQLYAPLVARRAKVQRLREAVARGIEERQLT